MGLYKTLPDHIKEVDVIVAGGGTAACIVASRLAEADPSLEILVIEGGPNNYNLDHVVHPALYLENLAPDTGSAIFYKGNKSKLLADREPIVPSGGILGGGSSINFMMYTRAQRCDFDSWKTPGWFADELIPFSHKLETYHGPGPKSAHGFSGPVNITYKTQGSSIIEDDIIQAAGQVGQRELTDLQDFASNDGVARHGRYIGLDGRRQDTAHRYLHPLLQDGKHPNLHVLVEHKVVRVLFDDAKRAVGVEYVTNPGSAPNTALSKPTKHTVGARKLVVVSSGALGSPSVLERSGVGNREVLERAGVPVVADVPGVGHDYQDHHLVLIPYKTNLQPEHTNDALNKGTKNRGEAIASNDPALGWNTIDFAAKIRPTDADLATLGPEFKAKYDRDFRDIPDRPLMLWAVVSTYLGDYSAVPDGQYITVGNYTAYPYSRGHIHITGPEVTDPLDFDLGFFADEDDIDLKKHIWAYKKQREVMRRTKLFRGELAIGHPEFPAGSKAALTDGPVVGEIRDLEYSAEDDRAIEAFVRKTVATTWHSLGTVKMAPREQNGAVDKDLNVYGVTGLKVVDLSIAPENVGANTNNTALTIGEKGADIIARELGIQLK
ncbi:alcohol dehydrogenase [Thozetella sp. PMI_491]|nr:alcohol dehydrogenase [Thozetella sp. PMI_491]